MKKFFRIVSGLLVLAATSSLTAQARKTDVWDFGGVADKSANNHISISDIDALAGIAAAGIHGDFAVLIWGQIAAAGLDVLAMEPMSEQNPLRFIGFT